MDMFSHKVVGILSRRVSVGRSRRCGVGLVHELCCYELGIWGPSGQDINGAVTSPSSPRFVTVLAPSSSIYRSRNSAPECQFSADFLSMKTGSNRPKETALS